MTLKVDAIGGSRYEFALELLREGRSFDFNDVNLSLDKQNGIIHIRSYSTWTQINEEHAMIDIQRGVSTFQYLQNCSPEFGELVSGFLPRFSLIDDYGTGVMERAFIENDRLVFT